LKIFRRAGDAYSLRCFSACACNYNDFLLITQIYAENTQQKF